jgi:hypothetical protein
LRRPITANTPGRYAGRYRNKQISDEAKAIAQEQAVVPARADNGAAAQFDLTEFLKTEGTMNNETSNKGISTMTDVTMPGGNGSGSTRSHAESTTAITPVGPPKLPAHLQSVIKDLPSGFGVSSDAEDSIMPLLTVLQAGSPQVNSRNDRDHIIGAEPGCFWLRNSAVPIRDGAKGIVGIPLMINRVYVEWKPNRAGFVARHDYMPNDAELIDGGDRFYPRITRKNGNIIEETRQVFLLVGDEPCVLPCTGTKHQFAKELNQNFKLYREANGKILPPFVRKYLFTTVPEKNSLGNWFGIRFQDLDFTTAEECQAALSLAMTIPQKGPQPK